MVRALSQVSTSPAPKASSIFRYCLSRPGLGYHVDPPSSHDVVHGLQGNRVRDPFSGLICLVDPSSCLAQSFLTLLITIRFFQPCRKLEAAL
jgi:hypothetical protein